MKDETVLIIENHYLLSILNSNQFDTFIMNIQDLIITIFLKLLMS